MSEAGRGVMQIHLEVDQGGPKGHRTLTFPADLLLQAPSFLGFLDIRASVSLLWALK